MQVRIGPVIWEQWWRRRCKRAGRSGVWIPVAARSLSLSYSKRPSLLWLPHSLRFTGCLGSSLRVMRPGPEADHSSQFGAEVNNKWSCTPTPSIYLHDMGRKAFSCITFWPGYSVSVGARGGAIGWGTVLQAGRSQVRFPMVSLEFFIDIILPAAIWLWGWLGL